MFAVLLVQSFEHYSYEQLSKFKWSTLRRRVIILYFLYLLWEKKVEMPLQYHRTKLSLSKYGV